MATSKMSVIHRDGNYRKNTENFECDPNKINVNIDSDTAVAVYNWALSYVALSKDSYDDVQISQTQNINEIIGE